MFSNTAFEAMYQYLGLELHSKFIDVITSQKVFLGIVAMIFGIMFFLTSVHFFSRYMPASLVRRKNIPLSQFIRIVFFLFIGIGMLKVGSHTTVMQFTGKSWSDNPYISSKLHKVQPEYKVSFIFDLLTRTAEETAALFSRVIDEVFKSANSQLEAPNFFFKAMMFAASSTIEDPELKRGIQFYTNECFDRMLPLVQIKKNKSFLDLFYEENPLPDDKLKELVIETQDKTHYTCYDVKYEVLGRLKQYALSKSNGMPKAVGNFMNSRFMPITPDRWNNLQLSSFLVNHYNDKRESTWGLQKATEMPGFAGTLFQGIKRFWSFAGWSSLTNASGASLAAERSIEFSENLSRAPHVAGFIKMILIAAFPWLLFFVVAGYWRVLFYWFLIYFSVLLWTPIWTLLYHIMVGITASGKTLEAIGKFDGISLYAADLVSADVYQMYAVYSWLQLLTGTLFTGMLLYFLRPALGDTQSDSMQEIETPIKGAASKAVGALI